MLAGLLGTFLGLVTSVQAIDGQLDQREMLAQLMRGTGSAIGSTVVSTIQGFVASVGRFAFSRLWR
jgi:biopolymer transport protein ExbB/TolQ